MPKKKKRKPGPRPGPQGNKIKVSVFLDRDIAKVTDSYPSRSKFINEAVRWYVKENLGII